jgi:hypothetical protein
MILQIGGLYFNPLQITMMQQDGTDTLVWFASDKDDTLRFVNWKVQDLANEINRRIVQFNHPK